MGLVVGGPIKDYQPNPNYMGTWQHWVNAILGLWVILSPFVGMDAPTMTTNLVIVGIVMALLAFWGAYDTSRQGMGSNRHLHA